MVKPMYDITVVTVMMTSLIQEECRHLGYHSIQVRELNVSHGNRPGYNEVRMLIRTLENKDTCIIHTAMVLNVLCHIRIH